MILVEKVTIGKGGYALCRNCMPEGGCCVLSCPAFSVEKEGRSTIAD